MKRKRRNVDCRKCVFFVPLKKCSDYQKKRAYRTMVLRNKKVILGYCLRFDRGVTYYFGKCWGFQPKDSPERLRKLVEFLKYI